MISRMTDKPAWLFRQSAAIPYLLDDDKLKIVLITSNSSGQWIFPKGVVERDLSPSESAAKEAEEEAGVIGLVSEEVVAEYDYEKWGGTCHVQVFSLLVLKVLAEWDEMHSRDRTIVDFAEALAIVKPSLKHILEQTVTNLL
jgi:8-oxo-dGTP pyrophosphatase MutT (NUDIX family)